MARLIHFPVTVDSIIRHSQDVATFWLKYAGRRPRFRPGQFIHLAIDPYDPSSHWPESRIFSIASSPSNIKGLRLTISRQGRFTSRLLDTVETGQLLWCKGPYGEFEVRPRFPGEEIVLVAGGTGITPFCAFMEQVLETPSRVPVPVTLHYGARSPALLAYRELAERCAQDVPGFKVAFYVEEGPAMAREVIGQIDSPSIYKACIELSAATFYLSGPKAMIVALSENLIASQRVPGERIVVDEWF